MIMVSKIPSRDLIFIELFVNIVDNCNIEFTSKAAVTKAASKIWMRFTQRSFMLLIYRDSLVSYRDILDTSRIPLLVSTQPLLIQIIPVELYKRHVGMQGASVSSIHH
jgi:hypothetical protein